MPTNSVVPSDDHCLWYCLDIREENMTELSFEDLWAPIYENPAWLVKKGHGSFLTFEFGQPELRIREPKPYSDAVSEKVREGSARRLVTVTGQWHLWIYCCRWSIFHHQVELAHCESPDDVIDRAANRLDGQKLKMVERGGQVGSWLFGFDLGGELRTRPCDHDPLVEQWMLYERASGNVLVARADGLCSYEAGDLPAHEARDWSKM